MNFFNKDFDNTSYLLSYKIYQALNLITKLEFPIYNQSDLENAVNKTMLNDNYSSSKHMIISSMSGKDYPLKNTIDALEKFYVVFGEIKPDINITKYNWLLEEKLYCGNISNYYNWIDFQKNYCYSNN